MWLSKCFHMHFLRKNHTHWCRFLYFFLPYWTEFANICSPLLKIIMIIHLTLTDSLCLMYIQTMCKLFHNDLTTFYLIIYSNIFHKLTLILRGNSVIMCVLFSNSQFKNVFLFLERKPHDFPFEVLSKWDLNSSIWSVWVHTGSLYKHHVEPLPGAFYTSNKPYISVTCLTVTFPR